MSSRRQHVSGYTRKNGTVVAGYDRDIPKQCNVQGSAYHSIGGKLSRLEREFASKRENFASDSAYNDMQERIKLGDEAHKTGEYDIEGLKHRQVQENIKTMGGVGKYDMEGKEAFAWNSLYLHHDSFLKAMKKDGFTIDNTVYYDNKDKKYYLTQSARDHADLHHYDYRTFGNSSLVKLNTSSKFSQQGGNVHTNESILHNSYSDFDNLFPFTQRSDDYNVQQSHKLRANYWQSSQNVMCSPGNEQVTYYLVLQPQENINDQAHLFTPKSVSCRNDAANNQQRTTQNSRSNIEIFDKLWL